MPRFGKCCGFCLSLDYSALQESPSFVMTGPYGVGGPLGSTEVMGRSSTRCRSPIQRGYGQHGNQHARRHPILSMSSTADVPEQIDTGGRLAPGNPVLVRTMRGNANPIRNKVDSTGSGKFLAL